MIRKNKNTYRSTDLSLVMVPLARFTLSAVSQSEGYKGCAHREEMLELLLQLSGSTRTSRIPSVMRRQPALFFDGFSNLKDKAAKILKAQGTVVAAGSVAPAALAATTPDAEALAAAKAVPAAEAAADTVICKALRSVRCTKSCARNSNKIPGDVNSSSV